MQVRTRFTMAFCIFVSVVFAQAPNVINYQGRLTTISGDPVTGTQSIQFAIYNAQSGGSQLWKETQSVSFSNGAFNVLLGDVTPFPDNLFAEATLYIGVKIGEDAELSPRQRLGSVGSAIYANKADSVVNGQSGAEAMTINSVSPQNGNITLVAGSNVSITPNAGSHSITISSSGGTGGGDITAVNAGAGLTGGGTSADVSLALDQPFTDARYVNESQANSVTSAMVTDNSLSAADLSVNVLSSLDGVSNDGGNVDLVAGDNITITPNDGANTITIAAAAGSAGDNLGNHTATQNIALNGHYLSNDGGGEGIKIDNAGGVRFESSGTNGIAVTGEESYFKSVWANYLSISGNIQANGTIGTPLAVMCGEIDCNRIDPGGNLSVLGGIILASNLNCDGAILCGSPTVSYTGGDIVAHHNLIAGNNVNCTSVNASSTVTGQYIEGTNTIISQGTMRTGNPSTSFTTGDIASTGDLVADDDVKAGGNVSAEYNVSASNNISAGGTVTAGGSIFSGNNIVTGSPSSSYTPNSIASTNDLYADDDLVCGGTKSSFVTTTGYGSYLFYCEEATEVFFIERGTGQLVNGIAHIEFDRKFAAAITVDEYNPMHVQVTLTDDCKGVYVTDKSGSGFTVKELMQGTSSATFDWEVACKRVAHEDLRLESLQSLD